MMHDLKPYPAYKDSGVPWLGQVPEHWQFERARWLFQKMDRPTREEDDVVTCFRDGTVTLRKNRRVRGFTESLKEIGYQGVRRGDLVIHAMDAFAGAIGVSDSDGKCTPVYSVCQPCGDANSYYYSYIVREMARSQWIMALAKGIRERSTDFRYDGFASQRIPIPPLSEQSAIVRYLDYMDRRIRRYIHAKQKLIKLLEEQKQAIIHRAVTRGLDTNVKLKSLTNEWFSEIPSHWQLLPLSRVIKRAVDGPHHSPDYVDSGVPFISARNIKVDKWSLEDAKYISEADYEEFSKRVVPESGDVLYTKGGTTGIAHAVDLQFKFQVWVHVAVLKLDHTKIDSDFLALVLNSPRCYEQSQLFTKGATNQDLGLNKMKDIVLPVPPINEQREILDWLRDKLLFFILMSDSIKNEINLLKEYRTRLITDVVTGKLDVREAAANLPEEVEEPEVLEDEESTEVDSEGEPEENIGED
ncbi:restriction endonuclease subunit S [Methanomethylovorans sp.]|uniref:restriction endonuclease subunit S n=1 Tax=Methanomethylovorans sp. TaxID=2758717 RepID=UPI002FDE4092